MASFLSGLASLFTGEDLRKSEAERQRVLNAGFGQLQDFTNQGMDALNVNYAKALEPFTGLSTPGPSAFTSLFPGAQQGTNAYLDVSGAAGIPGVQRAQETFAQIMDPFAGPMKAAAEATSRQLAGMGAGAGNVIAGTSENLFNKFAMPMWQNYVSGLSPFLGYGTNVAQGLDQYGLNADRNALARAGAVSGIHTGLGDRIASMFGNLGQGAYGLSKDIGQSVYNQGMAPTVGAGNALNLGTNLLAAFMNPAGFAAGSAGGLGSSLFNKYSGGLMGQNSRALVGG